MFAKPVANLVDREAQPTTNNKRSGNSAGGLMTAPAASLRNMMEKNHPRPAALLRWRPRLQRPKEAGRLSRKSTSHGSQMTAASSTSSLELGAANPMRFLQETCPENVLPLILAYAGPQQAAVLKRTNRHWKNILDQETTWKVMCQELYKWKEGDEEPESWKELYRMSPCVPVDFPNVDAALRLANAPTSSRRPQPSRQVRSVRILLRPGNHHLAEGLHIDAPANVSVTIESITLPPTCRWYRSTKPTAPQEEAAPSTTAQQRQQQQQQSPNNRARAFLQMLRCGASRIDFLQNSIHHHQEEPTENNSVSEEEGSNSNWLLEDEDYPVIPVIPPKRATMIMRSRRNNEPLVWVRQGQIHLNNVDLEHSCYGMDIWNGNAAVQVQPPLRTEEEEPTPLPAERRPKAALVNCRVKSKSGRGVVNIDGGHVDVTSCFIAGCAATGLYVGGPGSSAAVYRTDVFHNGRGNPRRRGIARGHSGVYLEQGHAVLDDCLVAANTLTGISAVSQEKAFLTLTDSTVSQNGTNQMELPPLGSNARNQSVIDNNELDAAELRSRSALWKAI